MVFLLPPLLTLALAAPPPPPHGAAPPPAPREYRDSRGVVVTLPLGDRAFADEVVGVAIGEPGPKDARLASPALALGPPDYVNVTDATYTTLGCGGAVTLRFTDNRVVDGPGADLHVFEIGPDVEPTKVALSEDGVAWVDIGAIKGGDASLDLAGKVPAGASFAWVRLTDLETACSGAWPGADIDAVAAINAALVLTLGAAALFDYDKDALRDDAQAELDWLAAELAALPPGDVEIVGHTDHDGSREYNLDLSRRRAEAVHAALRARLPDTRHRLSATGVGEGSPIASNATEEGRARNRRVEIVARPGPPAP